jgi:hypothetical protein
LRAVEASRGVDCWDRDVEVEDGDVEVHSFFSASFPLWLIHECFLFEELVEDEDVCWSRGDSSRIRLPDLERVSCWCLETELVMKLM